jgi:hypothetical protein
MKTLKWTKSFTVFSVYQGDKSLFENMLNTVEVAGRLERNKIENEVVDTCCNWQAETGFIVDNLEDILDIAKEYRQESVLQVVDGKGYLHYLADGRTEELGKVEFVTKEEAEKSKTFNYCKKTDEHFLFR